MKLPWMLTTTLPNKGETIVQEFVTEETARDVMRAKALHGNVLTLELVKGKAHPRRRGYGDSTAKL